MKMKPPQAFSKDKSGVLGQMQSLVTSLVAIAIVLAVGFLILSEVKDTDTVTANSSAENAIESTQEALGIVPDFLDIVVITVIGVALLGLVMYFRGGTRM